MAVTLDPNHFSPRSSASRLLVEALVASQNNAAARMLTRHFEFYLHGLNEMLKIDDNHVRKEALEFWHQRSLDLARQNIEPRFDKWNLPFHEYENILIHRMREARALGDLIAKMRS